MRSVGLKILKNKFSEYVRLAAGGENILITDRDRVVAEIVLPQPGRSPLLADAQLVEASREG
jgi:antitoxin (DNA-binding transcriptional repressor) of toxin-antitoxin stability system